MLSGCCGYVTIHMGSGKAGLDPLFYAIGNSDVPVQKFLPTHMGRTQELFEQGLEFVKRGGTIDMTAGLTREELEETADQILSYLKPVSYTHLFMSQSAHFRHSVSNSWS